MNKMKCHHCHKLLERNANYCPHCGKKRRKVSPSFIRGAVLATILYFALFYLIPFPQQLIPDQTEKTAEHVVQLDDQSKRVELVEAAQRTVYTLYTNHTQGSAFLYDDQGHVVTNAHVVEGNLQVMVKTIDGNEYNGQVIGYSNEIDVALLSVPNLEGEEPFPLEKEKESNVGEEVVALGTPLGLENTATFGYLTGVNRTFNIPPHQFEDVYQISAPIEPGNSGGPLLSLEQEKIIAINAAKSIEAENIAFSIPLHQVVPLIEDWIESPLNESEITALFYDEEGNYYYDLLWSLFEHYYFDDGYYLEDEEYHDYWIFDEEYDLWDDYYYDEWEEDWYYDEYDYYDEDEDYWYDEELYDEDFDSEEYEDYINLDEIEQWHYDEWESEYIDEDKDYDDLNEQHKENANEQQGTFERRQFREDEEEEDK